MKKSRRSRLTQEEIRRLLEKGARRVRGRDRELRDATGPNAATMRLILRG